MIAALEILDLAARRGERRLFGGFGLRLAAGEAVALTGANGAGKTTLLRIVAGLIRPESGRVRILDATGEADLAACRATQIHLVGHHDALKGGRTAGEELDFQVRWTGGTASDAARAVDRLGLTRLLALPVRVLSAGQRRRLALARLIASPRALWLLDEPLAPLDAAHRALLGEIMAEHVSRGGLILAAVHDPLPIPARDARLTP
ncbi:MAG: heme ABC exporter ATP-binding protein CcmA [Alphaproteobacteria bacterium]|nr:heme ABC exporter ATP-binding protein CcmA [Alphaproteobacteria bacterium]